MQEDVGFVAGETSIYDSTDLESALEITSQSKSGVPLSQVDGTKEVIIQESLPEEVNLNTTVEEDKSTELKTDSKEAKPTLNICGQFINCFGRIFLSKRCSTSCVSFFLLGQFFYLLFKFTEQYTEEQKDTEVIDGEISDLDTKCLESKVEAIESKDNIPLARVDKFSEMIVQDSFPEEYNLGVNVVADDVVERTDDTKQSAINITIHG